MGTECRGKLVKGDARSPSAGLPAVCFLQSSCCTHRGTITIVILIPPAAAGVPIIWPSTPSFPPSPFSPPPCLFLPLPPPPTPHAHLAPK